MSQRALQSKPSHALRGFALRSALALVACILMSAVVLPTAPAAAAECTNTYVGKTESLWTIPENWSKGSLPTSSDVVCIGSSKSVFIISSTNKAKIVQGEGKLYLSGGSLELVEETSQIATFGVFGGTLIGAGTLEITETFSWETGTIKNAGTTVVGSGATGTIYGGLLEEGTLINNGTIEMPNASQLRATEGSEVRNTGTWVLNSAFGDIYDEGGEPSSFVNTETGTLERTSGNGLVEVELWMKNSGEVTTSSGFLSFTGGGSSPAGTWQGTEEAPLKFSGKPQTFTGGDWLDTILIEEGTVISEGLSAEGALVTVGNGGTLSVATGKLEVGDYVLEYQGTLTGAGALSVSGSLSWSGGIMEGAGSTVLETGATGTIFSYVEDPELATRSLINRGTTTIPLEEALLIESEGAKITNYGTFIVNTEYATGIFGEEGKVSTFVNRGVLKKDSGTGTSTIAVGTYNFGTIKEETGELVIADPVALDESAQTPGHHCAGDPVDCATGNFSETQTDFAIDGRGVGLHLQRTYSAQAAAAAESPGPFGYGWTSSFSDRLEIAEAGKHVTVVGAKAGTTPFVKEGGVYVAPEWSQDTLTGSPEAGYSYTTPDQTVFEFSGAGLLEAVTDRNGNETQLEYQEEEPGLLEAITDPAGRQIVLTYNEADLVESAEDPMGHVVTYAYEGDELESVTLPGHETPRWKFEYDPSHRLTTMTNGLGSETFNEYDGDDRVILQTEPTEVTRTFEYLPFHTVITNTTTGNIEDMFFTSNFQPVSVTKAFGTGEASTTTTTYDEGARPLSRTDGNGRTTTYAYDPEGNLTKEVNAAGEETKWTYNETHDVLSMTTPEGEKTTIVRDEQGNPETVSRPAPEEKTQITSYNYAPNGDLESITDPREYTWLYEYNEQGDLEVEISPEGNKRTWTFDENSLPRSMVSPRGYEEGNEASEYTVSLDYTPTGLLSELVDPLEGTTELKYDVDQNVESRLDANENLTTYVYDEADRVKEVERPDSTILKNEYEDGHLVAQVDGSGEATTYSHNLRGWVETVTDPLNRATEYRYDDAGNLEELIDPLSRTTTYGYDLANRVDSIEYSGEETANVSITYNKDGQPLTTTDGSGESVFKYDVLGRLTKATQQGISVSFGYDLADNETSIIYPGSKEVKRAYDKANRLESVTDWSARKTSFGYDANSNWTSTTFPAETTNKDEYTYEPTDELSGVTMKKGAATVASLSYIRDPMGQLEKETQTGLPGAASTESGYSQLNQLASSGASAFAYDPADNLTKIDGVSGYEYDEANQLKVIPAEAPGGGATLGYDALGERTELKPEEGSPTEYSYDQAGRLIGVGSETHTYGGDGLRLSTTIGETTQYFTWDRTGGLPLLLSDGSTNYLYGPEGLPIEQVSAGGTPTYYHHDQLGSTRMLTNGSGEATATFSYAPYGAPSGSTGEQTTPMGFAGEYTDPESGLQYLRARAYDPKTGQFLSRDPLAAITRQPYSYGLNSPLNNIDPAGLSSSSTGLRPCLPPFCGQYAPTPESAEGAAETIWNGIGEGNEIIDNALEGLGRTLFGPEEKTGNLTLARKSQGGEGCDRNWSQDKKVTDQELGEADLDAHELKDYQKGDIYKDRSGNLYRKPKNGHGPGEDLGININDHLR